MGTFRNLAPPKTRNNNLYCPYCNIQLEKDEVSEQPDYYECRICEYYYVDNGNNKEKTA